MTRVVIKRKPLWRMTMGVVLDGALHERQAEIRAADIGEILDDDVKDDALEDLADRFKEVMDSDDPEQAKRVTTLTLRIERVEP